MTGVLRRRGEDIRETHRQETQVNTETESGVMQLQAREHQRQEEGKKDSLLEASKGAWPWNILMLVFWPLEL